MSTEHRALRMEETSEDQSVTTLELFFDLVFVFALTQVTALMADDLSTNGVIRGLLIVALLWWAWIAYAWLCNVLRADEGATRLAMLTAMGVMFVLALSIPEAFDDLPGGLPGPVVVAVCYFLFRTTHLVIFLVLSRKDPVLRKQVLKFTPSVLGGTTLLLVASQFDGSTQTLLWAAALTADYVGTLLGGVGGWRLRSPGHFAERFGLILIVALGESIVAIGVGVAQLPISWAVIGAAALGLGVAVGLWWTYFDLSAIHAEHAFSAASPADQVRIAQRAYSYLHFPLIAGVVLVALGMKKVLEYVGDTAHHDLADPLKGPPLYCLYLGAAVYLVGHVFFKLYILRIVSAGRITAAALLMVGVLLVGKVPAIGQLGIVCAILLGLCAFETFRYAEERDRVRHG
jgi:low temperature requirement protein LtrA